MKKSKTIPPELYDDFTLNGRIPVEYQFFDDEHGPNNPPMVWDKYHVDFYLEVAKRKEISGYDEDVFLYLGLEKYKPFIMDKDVAVIGSTRSCYESILLSFDAHPYTIEYNTIICEDPRIQKVYTVKEFENNPRTFDALLSVSSIEHDGLGRYGDPIDPYADLKFMEKARRMIPKEGLFFLQVSVAKDRLIFNAQRIYGALRLPLLLKGWKIVDLFGYSDAQLESDGGNQPLFVLSPDV